MVSKMKPLLKLWLLKIKGTIRNLFKRKASGVFVIIMILFYGTAKTPVPALGSSIRSAEMSPVR